MKKIRLYLFLVLIGYAGASSAVDKQITVHLSKLSPSYPGTITVEYVTCQQGPPCEDKTTYTTVISQDGDQKIHYSGIDMFFRSLRTQDGKYIWGPQVADYSYDTCSTDQSANSVTFRLNNDNSVTCLPGID